MQGMAEVVINCSNKCVSIACAHFSLTTPAYSPRAPLTFRLNDLLCLLLQLPRAFKLCWGPGLGKTLLLLLTSVLAGGECSTVAATLWIMNDQAQ